MKKKVAVYGILLFTVFISICYGIETKDKKLLEIKTAESAAITSFYEQMKFTNSNASLYIDNKTTQDVVEVGRNYLQHSFDQYFIQMVTLGLDESRNFQEFEDTWRSYWSIIANEELSKADLKQLQILEQQLFELKNEIENEEAALTRKIENYWWR